MNGNDLAATGDVSAERAPPVGKSVERYRTLFWDLLPRLLVVAVAVAAFVDYARRCAREIATDDPAELQVVTLAGGVPHGTSYPVYVWLARAFVSLPLGPLALRFNLFSAACAALALVAMAVFAAQMDRHPRDRFLAGAFAAAIVGLAHTFTEVAIFTGMYTLHMLLAFIALAFVARWSKTGDRRDIERCLLTMGVMLGNHIMTLALVPGVAIALLWGIWRDGARWIALLRGLAMAAVAFLVCDVFLFYLLWRKHVPFDHWAQISACPQFFELPPNGARSFWYAWWYEITCRQFRFELMSAGWEQRMAQLALIVPRAASELSPLALVLAVIGLARVLYRNARIGVMTVVVVMTHVWLVTGYAANNKTHIYLMTAEAVVACAAGVGLAFLVEQLARLARGRLRYAIGAVVVLAAVWGHDASRKRYAEHVTSDPDAAGRETVLANLGPRPDNHDVHQPLELARDIAAALPPRAIVFIGWPYMFTVQYVALYERRLDLEVYDPYPYGTGRRWFAPDYVARILDPARDRPVYFVFEGPPAIPGYHLVMRARSVWELVPDRAPAGG